jgi:hypothetical protein
MKQRRDVTPYMSSADDSINASLSLLKLYKRVRSISATYKPGSRYQMRLKHKRAARLATLHIVR